MIAVTVPLHGISKGQIQMASGRRSAFDYEAPSFNEATDLTASKRTSTFDAMVKPDGPRYFKARNGDNTIRILPPTWEGARHYSFEVWIHNEIGPDNQSYLCLDKGLKQTCPLCEERYNASQADAEKLRPRPRNYIYLIDRYTEDAGPLLWAISNTSDKEILSQSLIKRTQQSLPIAHLTNGYDIEFSREGAGIKTRYNGFRVLREASKASENPDRLEEWINYIDEHPIPDVLQYYPASHIKEVFHGRGGTQKEETPIYSRRDREPAGDRDDPPFDADGDQPAIASRRRPPIGANGGDRPASAAPSPNREQRDELRRRLRDDAP
jgi:hypothetical protein